MSKENVESCPASVWLLVRGEMYPPAPPPELDRTRPREYGWRNSPRRDWSMLSAVVYHVRRDVVGYLALFPCADRGGRRRRTTQDA
jgi:hypothetical protein